VNGCQTAGDREWRIRQTEGGKRMVIVIVIMMVRRASKRTAAVKTRRGGEEGLRGEGGRAKDPGTF